MIFSINENFSLYWLSVSYIFLLVWYPTNEPVSKCLLVWYWYPTNEPVSKCLQLLACVILIPYERTRIEVLAGACCITGSCLAGACLCDTDTLRTNLYRSACSCLLAGAWLLVTGACCITGSCLAGACLCGTDTLRTNPYRSACLLVLGCGFLVFGYQYYCKLLCKTLYNAYFQ